MKCPKCGNEVLSTDSHCSSCGAHFATIPQWRSCPKCGRANKSSNTECSFCHTLLDEQTVTIIPTPVKQPIENKPTPSAKQPVKKIPLSFEKQQGTQPTNVTQSNETLEDPYYKKFRSLPISLALGTALIGFILGCVLEEGWIFLVGLVLAFFTWYDARIIIAPIVTAINYLRAIERNTRKK